MEDRKFSSIQITLVLISLSFLGSGCYSISVPNNEASALILSQSDASEIISAFWKNEGKQYEEMDSRVGTTTYEQTIRYVNSGYAVKDELPSKFGNTGFSITDKGNGLFKSLCLNPENGGFWAEVLTHEPDLVTIDHISIDKSTGTAKVTATFEAKLTDEFKKFISPMPDYMKNEYNDYTYQKEFSLHKNEGSWQIEMPR